MSSVDETLAAAAQLVRSLARGSSPQATSPYKPSAKPDLPNGLDSRRFKLPGEPTEAKEAFETEIAALARRIQYLEAKSDSVNQALPDTPNEYPPPVSPFGKDEQNSQRRHPQQSPTRPTPSSNRTSRISHLLAARDYKAGDEDAVRTVSEADITYIREHLNKQAEQIKTQKDVLDKVSEELHEQDERTRNALVKVENEDVSLLERELRKHQQANEAFQKALREIGGIITQVANGDLSMRVQVHTSEMDPEIATFKRTINTMMDQLEVFGSEVSRVAREVGTEGVLGGQAQITGVHGIWKELTENGKGIASSVKSNKILTSSSQRNGDKPDKSSPRDISRHTCSRSGRSQPKSYKQSQRRNLRPSTDHQYHG